MKINIIYPLVFASLFLVGKEVSSNERSILLNDVNTLNIKEKLDNIPIENVQKICSYDYCDYIDPFDLESSLNAFTNKYLDTIKDDEQKNIIEVKGIKITKVIMDKRN